MLAAHMRQILHQPLLFYLDRHTYMSEPRSGRGIIAVQSDLSV